MSTIQKIPNKKGFSYRVFIRIKGLKTISKTFPNRQLAREFSNKLEGDRNAQLAFGGLSNTTTFADVSKEYLSNRYPGIKPPRSHEGRIEFWDKLFSLKRLNDVTKIDVTNGLKRLPEGLGNATINKYRAAASVVFNYACREFDLAENPTRHIRSLTEPRGRTRYLSEDEKSRLFKACRSSQWGKLYLLVLLAITTGARRGELLSLKWDNIDFDRKTAYVETSKNGEPKVLPLTEGVMIELDRFKAQVSELIFNSEIVTDKPYCFEKLWKNALTAAEIEDFTFHSLRHTCASYLAMNGASLLEIADVLGHRQLEMTKRYSHLCINHKSKLINRVLGSISDT